MLKFGYLLLIFLASLNTYAQDYWGKSTKSSEINEAVSVVSDANGNSYVAGYITGSTTFDTSVGFTNIQGNGDIYVAKYSALGALVWVKRFGGNASDKATNLAIDQNNDVVVTGTFSGNIDFEGQLLSSSNNTKDVFLLKMSANGDVIWAISEGGSGIENAYGIACDSQNNILLIGQFSGTTVIGGQNFVSQINPTNSQTSNDIFIAKYNAAGNAQWVKTGTAKYEDKGIAVTTDNQNNIYLTAQFSDTLLLAGSVLNNNAFNIGLLAKFSSSGSLQWMSTFQSGKVVPNDIAFDGQDVVITGDCGQNLTYRVNGISTTVQTGFSNAIFLAKVNQQGGNLWIKTLGSESEFSAKALALDANGQSYVTGYFNCAITELHESQTALYNSVGFKDVYLWCSDVNGNLDYVKTFGGRQDDVGNDISVLKDEVIAICGAYTENLNFPKYDTGNDNYTDYDVVNDNVATNVYRLQTSMNYRFMKLLGDGSLNSFLATAIHRKTPDYNYFITPTTDSLNAQITLNNQVVDTVNFCGNQVIGVNPNTFQEDGCGPAYNYQWSNGSSNASTTIVHSGNYNVTIGRTDGCVVGSDTVTAILRPQPALPFLNDNLGIYSNVDLNHQPSIQYQLCYPDSVTIWFSGLDSENTIEISSGTNFYHDTLPHNYSTGSNNIVVQNAYCSNSTSFQINFDYADSIPAFEPYLDFTNANVQTDTVTVCESEMIAVECHDSILNPGNIAGILPNYSYTEINWKVYHNQQLEYERSFSGGVHSNVGYNVEFPYAGEAPLETGYYQIELKIVLGYDNSCGMDTVHYLVTDSVYIQVLPVPEIPQIMMIGNSIICQGNPIYLSVNQVVDGYQWSGDGIQWQSPSGDSILVNLPGIYSYSGIVSDAFGCNSVESGVMDTVIAKSPPLIQIHPVDGVICPTDSVVLSVDDGFASYNWRGPQGDNLSDSSQYSSSLPGFYDVVVTDTDGCELVSSQVEIKLYSTPYLSIDHANVLCDGQSATIDVEMNGDGAIHWLQPVSGGNSSEIIANSPGWYVCQVSQCGISTTDSLQMIDGSFSLTLNTGDTTICHASTFEISATQGYASYQWSNGVSDASSIVIHSSDTYSATAENDYGCQVTSPEVTIQLFPTTPFSLQKDSLVACAGIDTPIVANGNTNSPVYWLIGNDTTLTPENQLIFNGQESTMIEAWTVDANQCTTATDTIFVFVPQAFIQISKDKNNYCLGDTANITAQTSVGTGIFQTPMGVFSSDTIAVILNDNTSGKSYFQLTDNWGCHYVDSMYLTTEPKPEIDFPEMVTLCENEKFGFVNPDEKYDLKWLANQDSVIRVNHNGWYYWQLTDKNTGCFWLDSTDISVVNCGKITVPNVITPNSDGINDVFELEGVEAHPNNYLVILNRWGNVVYEKHHYQNTFNGKGLADGVYFYRYYYDYESNPKRLEEGFLHIVR